MHYGQAIQYDAKNPLIYTNRAFARLKLEKWTQAETDCQSAIQYDAESMKAYFYMAQAQVELREFGEALASATKAYRFCLAYEGRSARHISSLILKIKQKSWEDKEQTRKKSRNLLVVELEERLEQAAATEKAAIKFRTDAGEISFEEAELRITILSDITSKKVGDLKSAFSIANMENGERLVPEYLIDCISFEIMHDPVITKSGHSYERSNILEHITTSATDPLTREPLYKTDLRPNLALKQACEEFLEKNGWAVDY
ncbi:MAG: hypothetical protein M1814_001696 [Vezdaea aestivalis]|nr:MAG: hypothetical protein M1814_001696 [Vezdaea aestivalis]